MSPGLRHEGDGVNHLHKSLRGLVRSRSTTCSIRKCPPSLWDGFPRISQGFETCSTLCQSDSLFIASHDERITLVKQLGDGKQRLLKFREESPAPTPAQPTDWGAQVATLQQKVKTLQSE